MRFEDFGKNLIPLLEKIGNAIEGKAKDLCPVDTGNLRSKIQHKVLDSEKSVVIGTNVPYAKYVEFMAPLEHPKKGRETGQMPFLRPSIFLSKNKIIQLIKEHFGR